MKKASLLKIMAVLLIAIAGPSGLFAQTQDEKIMQQIQNEIDEKYSKRLEQALKKDMGKFNKMKNDLEEVDKIKDNNGKKKGLDNYKGAHRDHFGKAIQESGVNLNQLLAGLQQKFPEYNFSIVDDFSIMVEKKATGAGSVSSAGIDNGTEENSEFTVSPKLHGPNAGSYSPAGEFLTAFYQELNFSQNRSVNCGAAAGGNVEFGYRTMKATTTGVIAGGCGSNGTMNNETLVPANAQSATLNLSGMIEVVGYAFSIIGTSSTYSTASVYTYNGNGNTMGWVSKFKQVYAPFLWYASFNEGQSFNYSIDVTAWRGRTIKVNSYSYSFSLSAICCATNSYGRVVFNSANLVVR